MNRDPFNNWTRYEVKEGPSGIDWRLVGEMVGGVICIAVIALVMYAVLWPKEVL